MPRTPFRVNPQSIFAWMSRNSLLEAGAKCEGEVTPTWLKPTTTLFLNEHLTIWSNWPKNWAVFRVLICTLYLTVCLVMPCTRFIVNTHSIFAWRWRNPFLETGVKSEIEVTATGFVPKTTKFLNEHSTIWSNWPNAWAVFWVLFCTVHFKVYSCHATYAFQSESTLFISLNVKELLAQSRREICRWSDCNWARTYNHLVLKETFNHLAKLAMWLSCVLSTYLHSAFDCMFLSCHVRVSWWIHTLYLTDCQGTPSSKQARNLKVKWLQWVSNPEPLSPLASTQPKGGTGQMLELCSDYLSVRCIWLYILVMPRTRFRVHPHSIFAWMSRNSLLEAGAKSEGEMTTTGLEPRTT